MWHVTQNYLSAADNMEVYTYQFYEVAVHVDQQSQLLERISIMEQAKSENRGERDRRWVHLYTLLTSYFSHNFFKVLLLHNNCEFAVFILLSYNYALMDLIYIAQLLNMLSGDYAFIASTLTLDNVFWNEAYSSYGLTSDLINGQWPWCYANDVS